jgi:Biopolymer transport protein
MDEEPLVNLTPLIDVVFVVLIMFILIAPLVEMERVQLAKGPSASPAIHELKSESPITLYVHKNNQVHLGKELVALNELTSQLKIAKAQYPGAKPQLFHDREGYFGTYQEVKNSLEEAGFEELDIVLIPGD